jgi:hypothetical protein
MLLALLLAGCEMLLGPAFGGSAFGEGPLASPSQIATYATGTVTIAIKGGETIVLDRMAPGSGVNTLFGSDVRCTGPSGWHVRIGGAGVNEAFGIGGGGYLTLDRIVDGQHWTTYDGSRCVVDIEVADAKAIRGTAACKGVEWYDALDVPFNASGPKELDEPKFDADVTYEATP